MSMMVRRSLLLLVLVAIASNLYLSNAFAPNSATTSRRNSPSTTSSRLYLEWEALTPDEISARTNFFIWFFGASGAAGIARSAFPGMYRNVMEIRGMKDAVLPGKKEEPMIGLSPLVGYPRDLKVSELNKVLNNKLNIEKIVEKYPIENNFLSKKGYITYEAFKRANAKADPLAVRAVFDCFAQSTAVSKPDIAQSKMDAYKEDVERFKSDLLYSKLVGWASILTLLGLLGLADIEAYFNLYNGWFPDWPGGRLWLEGGLFDSKTGFWTIPNYWI